MADVLPDEAERFAARARSSRQSADHAAAAIASLLADGTHEQSAVGRLAVLADRVRIDDQLFAVTASPMGWRGAPRVVPGAVVRAVPHRTSTAVIIVTDHQRIEVCADSVFTLNRTAGPHEVDVVVDEPAGGKTDLSQLRVAQRLQHVHHFLNVRFPGFDFTVRSTGPLRLAVEWADGWSADAVGRALAAAYQGVALSWNRYITPLHDAKAVLLAGVHGLLSNAADDEVFVTLRSFTDMPLNALPAKIDRLARFFVGISSDNSLTGLISTFTNLDGWDGLVQQERLLNRRAV